MPGATFRMKIPACYVTFLSLCLSFYISDREGQCSGLYSGLIECSFVYWREVMESDSFDFKF